MDFLWNIVLIFNNIVFNQLLMCLNKVYYLYLLFL